MQNLKPYFLLTLAAFLYCLGFPNLLNVYLPITPIISTAILLFYLLQNISTLQRVKFYLFYNLIITVFSFYWITATLQEFGNLPFFVAAFMNTLYALIFNPHYWILILTLHFITKHKPQWRLIFSNHPLHSLGLATCLTVLEYMIPQQFPVMLGQPWVIFGEHLGLADVFGLPAFSFFSYLLAIELKNGKNFNKPNISFVLVFLVSNILFQYEPNKTPNKILNVRLVQANISNFLKVEAEKNQYASSSTVIGRYKELSVKPFYDNEQIDLIVWPETAYPYALNTYPNDLNKTFVPNVFKDIISTTKSEILFGGYDHFRENPKTPYFKTDYNSAIHLDKEFKIKNIYHKQILIPFGETLPLGPLNEKISPYLPEVAFFAEGSTYPVFTTNKDISFIGSICYEILRPEFVRRYLNQVSVKPDFLMNLTNDSWYGNTVEPEQHLFLTRWRALEYRLPIIRSTNTGISTLIDVFGQEIKRLEYAVTGNLDYKLQVTNDNKPTLFQRFGFLTLLPILMLCFLFQIILIKFKHD